MTISVLLLFCKKGTNHCLSNRESAPSYKTEAMCKGKQMIVSVKVKQMIVSVKVIVSILEMPLQHM